MPQIAVTILTFVVQSDSEEMRISMGHALSNALAQLMLMLSETRAAEAATSFSFVTPMPGRKFGVGLRGVANAAILLYGLRLLESQTEVDMEASRLHEVFRERFGWAPFRSVAQFVRHLEACATLGGG